MDHDAFKRSLRVRLNRSEETIKAAFYGLARLHRKGFSLERFQVDSNLEAETYLSRRLENGATPYAYNNDLFVLRNLAKFLQLPLDIKPQRIPKAPLRVYSPAQLRQIEQSQPPPFTSAHNRRLTRA